MYTLENLMKKLGYEFQNIDYLKTALTHSSYANEHKNDCRHSYERLEFLGDSILQFISSDYIFRHFNKLYEGKMSKLRASLVCEPSLARVANMYNLADYIMLSRGERVCNGVRDSILCDVVESVIAAIYLDGGFEPARDFVLDWFEIIIKDAGNQASAFVDYKSKFQEMVQDKGKQVTYEVVDSVGPDHDKIFMVEVLVEDVIICSGEGKSKKAAEQDAAKKAINKFDSTGIING